MAACCGGMKWTKHLGTWVYAAPLGLRGCFAGAVAAVAKAVLAEEFAAAAATAAAAAVAG